MFLCFPFLGYSQKTYIPDDAFEQALINLNLDGFLDDSVYTSAIDTVEILYLSNEGISDLTGIESFVLLSELYCNDNQITYLDLSDNSNLFEFNCSNNFLTSLDIRNGNNTGLWYFSAFNNPQLYCISVNDISFANLNWLKDIGCTFSSNCGTSSIENYKTQSKLIRVLDVFGRRVTPQPNMLLLYFYSDGTTEKKFFKK